MRELIEHPGPLHGTRLSQDGPARKQKLIRILTVDDHPVVCAGLAAITDAQPDMATVAQASNGIEAIELFKTHRPDVTIMDLRMPTCGGIEAVRVIRTIRSTARVVMLTTFQRDEEIRSALAAGAQGYLLKSAPPSELLRAIRSVYAGIRYLPPSIESTLQKRSPEKLTPRELEILRSMSKGFSNKQIGDELNITVGTVKWHLNIIFGRLHAKHRTQAVLAAVQRGIVDLQ